MIGIMANIYVERPRFKVILLGCEDWEKKSDRMTITNSMLQHIRQKAGTKDGHQRSLETIFTVHTENRGDVDLRIHDTAGQERYKSLTTSFFRHSYASIIVFDITDEKAFNKVKDWHVILSLNKAHMKSTDMFLVGTFKGSNELTDTSSEAREFAEENELMYSKVDVSNKSQVISFFTGVANHISLQLKETSLTNSNIHLSKSYEYTQEKKKCSC